MSTAGATVASRLGEIAGPSHVRSDPSELAAYRIGRLAPAAVVRPGSIQEIAEIVRFATAEKLAIVPTGARTKLAMGAPPARYDLALDLGRLNRVAAYDPADLTLGVEPGLPLAALAQVLRDNGQFLPLSVPFFSRATVGGTISSGIDAPLRQFCGTARDFVLGMEFVTGDGTFAKSGGRVVKNVSGYDIHKLLIGSAGTLAILTRVNFRTFPLPPATRGFAATFRSVERAIELRNRIAQSPLRPLTLEILSPGAVQLLSSETAGRIEPDAAPFDQLAKNLWACTVSFAGSEATLARYQRDLAQLAQECGAGGVSFHDQPSGPGGFPRLREFIPIALDSSPATTILKLSVLPSRMNDVFEAIGRAAESAALPWAALARGLGVIYVALLPPERNDDARLRTTRAIEPVLSAAASHGGNAAIPWGPAERRASPLACEPDSGSFALMQKLKKVFDPHGTLSPGRLGEGL